MADADNDDPSQNAGDGEYSNCQTLNAEEGDGGKEEQDEEEEEEEGEAVADNLALRMYSLWRRSDCQSYAARATSGEDCDGDGSFEENAKENQQDTRSPLYGLIPGYEDSYSLGEELFSFCHRPLACRKLVYTLVHLVQLTEKQDDILEVFEVVEKISDDTEPCLKAELIEHVPHFAMVVAGHYHDKPDQHSIIAQRIVPLLTRFLMHSEPQVRKSSQEVLRLMRQRNLIDQEVINTKICPFIVNLTCAPDSITQMTKMVPVLGREATEEFFVPRLVDLSSDTNLNIRRACIANFGEYCAIVSTQVMENVLLPCFVKLCQDKAWEVRKACAEVIMSVSCVCRLETRKATLAPVCAELLADPFRWVQVSAFQTLGPFITTFAQPSITGLAYNQNGQLVLTNNSGFEFSFLENPDSLLRNLGSPSIDELAGLVVEYCSNTGLEMESPKVNCETEEEQQIRRCQEGDESDRRILMKEKEVLPQEFDSFLFWRDPLPELEDVPSSDSNNREEEEHGPDEKLSKSEKHHHSDHNYCMSTCSDAKNIDTTENKCTANVDVLQDNMQPSAVIETDQHAQEHGPDDNTTYIDSPNVDYFAFWQEEQKKKKKAQNNHNDGLESTSKWFTPRTNRPHYRALNSCRKNKSEKPDKPRQDIVPQELIEHFVSLTNPDKDFGTLDCNFLAYHIAYSLPAVAMTLGKENWTLLKGLYESLAVNTGWKVRRAVASSIHELAVILGEDAATQDLVPIFNGIIKDLDEVRIGALKHLANFLKRLKPAGRNSFLPKLAQFLMTDYDMNWRFREELAEQLLQMVGLFSPVDTYTHLMPLATVLLLDKVAAVRKVALSLVTELVRCVSSDMRLLHSMLVELAEQFSHSSLSSSRWRCRQTFALLCSQLITQSVLPDNMFATIVLPHLIDLSWDAVPNVRLAVARTLASDVAEDCYFKDPQNPHHDVVMETLKRLQEDKDRDVRYMATCNQTQTMLSDSFFYETTDDGFQFYYNSA